MDRIQQLKKHYEDKFIDQHVPFCIKRNDGALLLLNNDFETYSFWRQSNGKPWLTESENDPYDIRSWSLNGLFRGQDNEDPDFIIESWAPIENLFRHPEKYFTYPCQIKANKRIILGRNENTRTSITWGTL